VLETAWDKSGFNHRVAADLLCWIAADLLDAGEDHRAYARQQTALALLEDAG
jgi:hypothetical protein